jgi:hypothetical protein
MAVIAIHPGRASTLTLWLSCRSLHDLAFCICCWAGLCLASAPPASFAYRPFDSTDADVAKPGEFELELGPIGSLREGANKYWVAPAVVANIGIKNGELVLQGQRQQLREGGSGVPSTSVVNTGVFMKQVLRNGALQDAEGPSVATEYGLLLPTLNGEHGAGFSWAGIVSQRWAAATVHLNTEFAYTREHKPDAFLGAIIEGPYEWPVRPVMELFVEQASGSPRIVSRLIGMIWRSKEQLSFDVGIRSASAGDLHINEIRVGFTWGFPTGK